MGASRKIVVAIVASVMVVSTASTGAPAQMYVPKRTLPDSTTSLHDELNGLRTRKIVGETRRMELNHNEHRAVKKIRSALAVKDYGGAAAALDAATALAQSGDAKFVLAGLKLQLGSETHNVPLQDQAIEEALASGAASNRQLVELYRLQGLSGLRNRNIGKAEVALNKFVELAPTDPEAYVLAAEAKHQGGRPAEALSLLEHAITLKSRSGEEVPAKWMGAKAALAAEAVRPR